MLPSAWATVNHVTLHVSLDGGAAQGEFESVQDGRLLVQLLLLLCLLLSLLLLLVLTYLLTTTTTTTT